MTVTDAGQCTVSVLVPAYNAGATLAETLQSVQGQTHADIEVIVIDDGSSDDTARLAADFVARDDRFRLVLQENAGVAAARNTALAMARGDWIAPLDADDIWHPGKLARQVSCLRAASPDPVLVYSWSVDIDEHSRVISRRLDLDSFEGDVYAALVLTNFIGNASVPLIRRDALLAIGGWDPSLRTRGAQGCEDWQVYLRLAEIGDFALARGFLVGYRQTASSMSRKVAEMTRSYDLVLAEAAQRHPELPAALFRWSRAAFDFYRFEMLYGSAARIASLRPLLSGISRDPQWLLRRSTRRKIRRSLLRPLDGLRKKQPKTPPQDFYSASPEPPYELSDGPWSEARRSCVAAIRSRRRI